MKLHKQILGIAWYRKLRYRKGHGVHSPFVYSFITKVIEEKSSFYAFDKIEKLRKEMTAVDGELGCLTRKETQHRNYGALLFRMVNFFKCNRVIQLGASTGIMSLYLAMASQKQTKCYLLEKRPNLLEEVKTFSKKQLIDNLHFMEMDYEKAAKILHSESLSADLLFINGHASDLPEGEEIFSLFFPLTGKKTILIIDNINKDKNMKELWAKLSNCPQARVSLDLYVLGIIFFDANLPKKHYKTYFNYGKKQDIYKNRRRRFYFIGWGKEGFKNKLPH